MRVGKFGLVNNFLPYYHLEKEQKYEFVEEHPKKLAEMLLEGKIDYAPVPSFFYLKNRERLRKYSFCVGSDGEVYSVVVVSRKKRLDDSPIAVTSKSLTSVSMLEIIRRQNGLINRLVPHGGNFFEMLKDFDHALVIGDEAITARMVFRIVMDVGEEWKDLTGLPAVFGISASLMSADAAHVDSDILRSYQRGLKNIDEIAEIASLKYRMPVEFLRTYFKALVHKMSRKEEKSLRVFGELGHECGLL